MSAVNQKILFEDELNPDMMELVATFKAIDVNPGDLPQREKISGILNEGIEKLNVNGIIPTMTEDLIDALDPKFYLSLLYVAMEYIKMEECQVVEKDGQAVLDMPYVIASMVEDTVEEQDRPKLNLGYTATQLTLITANSSFEHYYVAFGVQRVIKMMKEYEEEIK